MSLGESVPYLYVNNFYLLFGKTLSRIQINFPALNKPLRVTVVLARNNYFWITIYYIIVFYFTHFFIKF